MGVRTDGQLSYGVVFDEGFEFPWDADEFEGSIEAWWKYVKGFVNPVEYPCCDDGENYKPGIHQGSPIIKEYYAAEREWQKANPIPVEVVNYCSYPRPMYIIATKHTYNRRGDSNEIDLEWMLDIEEYRERLINFLNEFGIEFDEKPRWYLSSFWDG